MATWTATTVHAGAGNFGPTRPAIDGDYVVMPDYGAAYVFKWNGASYDLLATLTNPESIPPATGRYGTAVALQGQDLLVSDPQYAEGQIGAVHRYTLISDVVTYVGRIDSPVVQDYKYFGSHLSISENYAFIASMGSYGASSEVSVHQRSDWARTSTLTVSTPSSMAVDTRNEAWLAVGSKLYGASQEGRVSVYPLSAGVPGTPQHLDGDGGIERWFGFGVDVNGTTLAACEAGTDSTGTGHAFIYKLLNGAWTRTWGPFSLGDVYGNTGAAVDETYSLAAFTNSSVGTGTLWLINTDSYETLQTWQGGSDPSLRIADAVAIQGGVVAASTNFDAPAGVWRGANFKGLPLDSLTRREHPQWRCRLMIEGVSKKFYQFVPSSGRTDANGYYNLLPPKEFATEFNLAEMKPSLSAMTFELLETDDNYLRKNLAPAAWAEYNSGLDVWQVSPGSTIGQQVNANATTIPLKSTSGVAAGEYSIGQETISCTGTDATGMTGVQKGLYPPFYGATYWGRTHQRPQDGDAGYLPHVARAPFSWHGKMVCLYIDVWDPWCDCWNDEEDGLLMWTGRISDSINYDPAKRCWQLSCESIIADLEKELFNSPPTATLANVVNVKGDWGRSFYLKVVERASDGTLSINATKECTITIPKGIYSAYSTDTTFYSASGVGLASLLNDMLAAAMPGYPPRFTFMGGRYALCFHGPYAGVTNEYTVDAYLEPWRNGYKCHVLQAMGFDVDKTYQANYAGGAGVGWDYRNQDMNVADELPWEAYHPLSQDCNGGNLLCEEPIPLIQPSGSLTSATAIIRDVHWGGNTKRDTGYVFRYTSHSYTNVTLADTVMPVDASDLKPAFCGRQAGQPQVGVEQIWAPETGITHTPEIGESTGRGPFECLLFPMLSTGTQAYNHATYDILPVDMGAGIPAPLVDIQSFLDADKAVMSRPLAIRSYYPIDKPASWMALYQREAKIFGYGLTWNRGKLRLINIRSPESATISTWIDEGSRYNSREMPKMTMSTGTVVNQWECKIYYDAATGKYKAPVVITNVNSVTGLCVTKKVTIEHPGIVSCNSDQTIVDLLKSEILPQTTWLSYPLPIIEVSLQPRFIYSVWTGEVVAVSDKHVPSPLGDEGTLDRASCIPLKVSWDYNKKRGAVTLMVTPFSSPHQLTAMVGGSYYMTPMSPSLLVTSYDDGTKVVDATSLWGSQGDAADTSAFTPGDYIEISETTQHPAGG